MKLCLVGGHLTPALSLADHALARKDRVFLVGRCHTSENHSLPSLEPLEAQKRHIPFFPINTPKINQVNFVSLITLIPRLLQSTLEARRILQTQRPHAVVAFGSYVSVPVGFAAKSLGIPLFIHEQTAVAGLANRLLAPLAKTIAIGFKEAQSQFPQGKTSLVGNPIRPEFFQPAVKPAWVPKRNKPILYITGGSQGSAVINQVTASLYLQLTNKYRLVHQCGGAGSHRARELSEKYLKPLPATVQAQISLREWLSARETAWCYQNAQIIVSRAGANSVSEIICLALPSILVPLPQARFREQAQNAAIVSRLRSGVVIPQFNFNQSSLISSLDDLQNNYRSYKARAVKAASLIPQDAVNQLYQLISRR